MVIHWTVMTVKIYDVAKFHGQSLSRAYNKHILTRNSKQEKTVYGVTECTPNHR